MLTRDNVDQLITQVATRYYDSLAHKDSAHDKYLMLFSGVPGSGKSTVAGALERELDGLRFSNDEIRDQIMELAPEIKAATREHIKSEVVSKVMGRLAEVPNGLIIIDASCDRGYDDYATWAANRNYRIILLRMEVSRDVIERRIVQRGNQGYRDASRGLGALDTWWRQWEEFGQVHEADLTITEGMSPDEVVRIVGNDYVRL